MPEPLEPLARPDQTVVIVGAGLAGVKVAEGLREAGFPGRVVMIGEEPHAPYDRPPLSKAVLTTEGHEAEIGLWREPAPGNFDLDLLLGLSAVTVDRDARRVRLSDGRQIGYDRLVLATGSSLRLLEQLPPRPPRIHYLRDLNDALALRQALAGARRVAVVGGGVIGLEVAAAAVGPERSVTVIEAGERVMGRAACPLVCDFLLERHQAAGVSFHFGVTVMENKETKDGIQLRLSNTRTVEADLVVVGVGVTPNMGLARDCGLEVDSRGVKVDAHGRTSDPAIYAAGEVALHLNALSGTHERQETWAHALAHGEHVGRALVAHDSGYAEPSAYWTDQYDFTLNVFGTSIGEQDVVRGDPASGKFLVFHLIGGRVAGVSAVNDARGLRAGKALIGQEIDPDALADATTDLKGLALARAA